jgi:hypothetical protein
MTAGALDGHDATADPIEFLGSQVEEVMSAARTAAAQLQAEVQRASTERAAQIETAAARRAHAVRMDVETEAERLHVQALVATRQYVTASRRLVDEFATERMRRIAEIGDRLAEQADALVRRMTLADEVARQLDELRAALGAASERIAVEAGRDSPETPELPRSAWRAAAATADEAPASAPVADAEVAAAPSLEARLARATGRSRRRLAQAGQSPAAPAVEEAPDDA